MLSSMTGDDVVIGIVLVVVMVVAVLVAVVVLLLVVAVVLTPLVVGNIGNAPVAPFGCNVTLNAMPVTTTKLNAAARIINPK